MTVHRMPKAHPRIRRVMGSTLPLIRAAVARGVPLLAICRGFQELKRGTRRVTAPAAAKTCRTEMDHSSPMQPSSRVRQGKAHAVRVTPGRLAAPSCRNDGNPLSIHCTTRASTSSPPVWSPKVWPRTARSRRFESSPARLGQRSVMPLVVQWHPEYDWRTDSLSRLIFEQFGAAIRAYADAGAPRRRFPIAAD